jgi:hypothetical protein
MFYTVIQLNTEENHNISVRTASPLAGHSSEDVNCLLGYDPCDFSGGYQRFKGKYQLQLEAQPSTSNWRKYGTSETLVSKILIQ